MALLEFINSNPNWKNILAAEPYNISIVEEYPFTLLKYKKDRINFSDPIVRECRGSIVFYDDIINSWRYACRPFDKFQNYYNEDSDLSKIDWSTAVVKEKVDGSLIKVWYSRLDRLWHISTNGTIDADKTTLPNTNITYFEYFKKAFGAPLQVLLNELDYRYTYMFELVGPDNHLIVDYPEPAIYFLAARNTALGYYADEKSSAVSGLYGLTSIKYPGHYNLHSLKDCVSAAERMNKNQEGFVVNDAFGNRIKIKSPEYLKAAAFYNNGVLTTKNALELIQEGKVDDFLDYIPIYKDRMNKIIFNFNRMCSIIEYLSRLERRPTRKEHYQDLSVQAKEHIPNQKLLRDAIIGYGMVCYDGKNNGAANYLFNMKSRSKLVDMVEEFINNEN